MTHRPRLVAVLAAAFALGLALANGAAVRADDVACTGALGEVQTDNLIVPPGAACTLTGTRVDGNISIRENASLNAQGVRVDGHIQAQGAANVVIGSGSDVDGSIQISQSGTAQILSVTIDGSLEFEGNTGFLLAEGSNIEDDLRAFENRGGVLLRNNRLGGDLQCLDNDPPPSGSGNQVGGEAEGQCAGLEQNPSPVPTQTGPAPTLTPTATSPPATPTRLPPGTPIQPPSSPAAPVANDDAYTLAGAQIVVPPPGILANDQLPAGQPVEVVLLAPPQHGAVALGPEGGFSYQAQSGYFGEDGFEYALRRAGVQSNAAQVHLAIPDLEPPTVQWVAPVLEQERYDVSPEELVVLRVEAGDNDALERVVFLRWDALSLQHLPLGEVVQPPFQISVDAGILNPGWNQIFVFAVDVSGNNSDSPHIWLYRSSQGGGQDLRLFLPVIGKE